MKKIDLRFLSAACISTLFLAFSPIANAQNCGLSISPPNDTATCIIEASPAWWNYNYAAAANPALLLNRITTNNAGLTNGTYLSWCIDVPDQIGGAPETYATTLYSSCDTNIDHDLPANYPNSVYVSLPAWHAINYILNHKDGAYFYDVQIAIWTFVGGPVSVAAADGFLSGPPDYPPYTNSEVNALVTAASNNAASWQPGCGDVIAVVVAISATPHDQLTIIEVPFQCPRLTIGAIGNCYTNFAEADEAALAATTGSATCGGTNLTLTVSDNGQTCPATITVTGTDNCGNSTNVTYTATILTNPPTLSGVPASTNVLCAEDISTAPTVTATDSCGTLLLVSYTQTETDASSICSNVITRTWSAVDCAGQPVSYTQVIAQLNDELPTLNNVPSGSNYGCNPASIPTTNSILTTVTATDNCSSTPAMVSAAVATNIDGCLITQVFTITAVDSCSNMATAYVTNTWTANTTPPVISGVPGGTNYGCNPASVPSSLSGLSANSACGTADIAQTNVTTTNGCEVTQLFTIVATDGCGNTATAYVTNTWTANTTSPTISGVPAGTNYGCNPASVPSSLSGLSANSACGSADITQTNATTTNGCSVTQIFTIVATDGCGNTATAYVTNTWTANTTPPTISGVPAGTNYGCNPASVPSSIAGLSASDACGTAAITQTNATTTNGCSVTQIFTITATDGCGNTATAYVTNTWTANTTPPVISGVPAGTNYGCNPASVPSSIAGLSASDACGTAAITQTNATTTNGCSVTQIFTIVATDGCGNTATAYVTNTWTANTTPPTISGVPAGTNYGCNPASVPSSLTGLSANSACGSAVITQTNATTTNGCSVTQIFTITATDGCGNTATAYVTNTWTANTTPPTISGVPAGTNYGCNPASVPSSLSGLSANSVCGTADITQTNVTTTNGCEVTQLFTIVATDGCGNTATAYVTNTWTANTTPPVISGVPGGTNYGCNPASVPTSITGLSASDACGSAAITQTNATTTNGCSVTQIFTITATDGCGNTATAYVTNTWTANTTPPTINGVPAGTNYGCNPANVVTSISGLSASDACGTAAITQTNAITTNGCEATQIFTIVATDGCGNTATAYVTNTWTANTTAPVLGGVPIGANLGCNPASVPTLSSVQAAVYSTNDTCSPATVHVTGGVPITNGCGVIQIFTIIATNACGNTATASVTNTWTANTIMPVLSGVPIGMNLGCNPASVPTLASVQAVVSSTNDTCSPATVHVTGGVPVTNGCGVIQIFTITATNACGNTAVAYVTNTWAANTTAPVLSGVPAGTNYGCSAPASVPTVASVAAEVTSTNDTCSPATVHVTGGVPVTNGCEVIQIFTIIATNACGNTATAYVTNTWNSGTGPVVQCPTNVTIITNLCQICCTFTPNDWCSSCIGYNNTGCNNNNWNWNWNQTWGWNSYGNNWWTTWSQNNPPTNCWPSWSNWWWSCNGTAPGANWWGNWTNIGNGNHWSGCWTAQTSGNWWNTWANNNTYGNQSWVPCGGNNPGDILTNCFGTVYSNGCVQIGQPGSGYCLTFTSPTAVRNCLNFTGNPGVFNCNATNPTSCNAGSFCSQVLALQLNVNFGDCSNYAPSFFGRCGDAVLTDSTSPCNGQTVREILGECNTALGCGSLPPGCTLSNLCCLASNLNKCFEGCQVSGWCGSHLARVYIPPPSQTGTATVTDTCSPNPTLTYCDSVATNASCQGNYIITRTWLAVDACGHSNSCSQTITIEQGSSSGVSGAVVLACSGDTNLSNNEGISNVTVTLKNASGATVATTTTSATGTYAFTGLPAGTYTVTVTPPSGYSETCPSGSSNSQTVALSGCQVVTGVSFGYNGSTPAVSITKTGPNCIAHGQTATYCFAVTNTGNTCLSLQVNDALLGGIIFTEWAVSPGQGYVFSANYVVTQTNGTLTNTAWAIGTPPSGGAVSNKATTIATITTKCITNTICGNFNSQNPGGGWLWCNAHISGNPGKKVTVFCQNASVTLTCNNGQTYTYPIPNGQINFSPSCTVATNWFDGTQWNTTLPCGGDSGIFLQGCCIPWQSAFANCHTVCWTGVFSCDTAGFNCNWQWGAACYNNTQPSCGSICPKACTRTSCPNGQYYSSGDQCGAPENCKPYCVAGATGGGGSNCTGSWSSTGSCSF